MMTLYFRCHISYHSYTLFLDSNSDIYNGEGCRQLCKLISPNTNAVETCATKLSKSYNMEYTAKKRTHLPYSTALSKVSDVLSANKFFSKVYIESLAMISYHTSKRYSGETMANYLLSQVLYIIKLDYWI